MVLDLAWRLFRHEARRGELSIILAAIILSVASVLSLSLFSERLQTALTAKSAEFIAADAVLDADKAVDPLWIQKAQSLGLNTAHQVYTRSMVFANDELSLSSLRAASSGYPLKGQIKVADEPFSLGEVTSELPNSGETWVESRLFQALELKIGDTLEVGESQFIVTKVLVEVPDAGFSIFATDPKVLIPYQDLAATKVTGPGSRITYSYFFSGDDKLLESYYQWLEPQLNRELHDWSSVKDDDSALGSSVARAERFFLLASLLAIVLASVSIAVAAQRYSQRHFDPVAIMKTLGASRSMVQKVYLLQILFISVLGISLGAVAGYVIQYLVAEAISDRVDVAIASWHWRPFLMAVFTGAVCAALFSLYPLLKLFSVPPLRVLRRQLESNSVTRLVQYLASGGAILLLMWLYSRDWKISLILFAGGIMLILSLLAVTYGLIRVGRKFAQGRMGAWQLAWARIQRRSMDNSVQLISFSVTIMLLLVVLVMRNDMLQQWRDQLPEGTPNYFMSNITQQQLPKLQQHFAQSQVQAQDFYPVIRGRMVSVNQELVNTEISKEDPEQQNESRQGLGREANLTWSNKLQHENRITQGVWLDEYQPGHEYGVSVEENVAERLEVKLGDKLTFNIGSEVLTFTVTSLRSVNWQTMQPNFFFILQPEAMAEFSPTYITSFYLDAERKVELAGLMAPFASVTLFDVDARINQFRNIVSQVSAAVEFILVLVLVAGALVLIAQVQASMDERQQELAILRTLGAKGRMIRASVLFEFLIIGSVAVLMAAVANEVTLYMLQQQVFQMQSSIHLEYWLLAPVVGAAVVGLLGAVSCRRLLSLNTSHLLRQMV